MLQKRDVPQESVWIVCDNNYSIFAGDLAEGFLGLKSPSSKSSIPTNTKFSSWKKKDCSPTNENFSILWLIKSPATRRTYAGEFLQSFFFWDLPFDQKLRNKLHTAAINNISSI